MTSFDPSTLFRSRGCSRQWLGFVRAMAEEFAAELPDHELATLMARIGRRFAQGHPIGGCAALDEVEAAANRIWADSDWGQCRLQEQPGSVEISHAAAPLTVALPGRDWADGFLAGVYEGWFQQLGMLAGLAVSPQPPAAPDLRRLRLARAA
ncbi:MAG TPA: hypothetical protein VD865_05750 [Stenotrophomonas sp.]|nr:hypothetical protein [Stenotrophomonas sp.]